MARRETAPSPADAETLPIRRISMHDSRPGCRCLMEARLIKEIPYVPVEYIRPHHTTPQPQKEPATACKLGPARPQ
jgi:hypothetical protein